MPWYLVSKSPRPPPVPPISRATQRLRCFFCCCCCCCYDCMLADHAKHHSLSTSVIQLIVQSRGVSFLSCVLVSGWDCFVLGSINPHLRGKTILLSTHQPDAAVPQVSSERAVRGSLGGWAVASWRCGVSRVESPLPHSAHAYAGPCIISTPTLPPPSSTSTLQQHSNTQHRTTTPRHKVHWEAQAIIAA